jgi:hypothetical protein
MIQKSRMDSGPNEKSLNVGRSKKKQTGSQLNILLFIFTLFRLRNKTKKKETLG